MLRLPRTATACLLALALTACDRDEDRAPAAEPPPQTTASPERPVAATRQAERRPASVPVETFLADGVEIPERLASRSLRLTLRSNVEDAVFECRMGQFDAWGRGCMRGDTLVLGELADGNAYHYELRAVSSAGAADATPLVVAFVVDLERGRPLGVRDGANLGVSVPATANDLPAGGESSATQSSAASAVALGRSFAVVLPLGHRLSSYATDLTYNGRIKLFMALETASTYGAPACDQPFERVVAGRDGARYCDATPGADELPRLYRRPLPRNHVETFRGRASSPEEKLFLAAFSEYADEADPVEERLDVAGNCKAAVRRGSAPVPLLSERLGGRARDRLDWCLVQGADGAWWWIGGFKVGAAAGRGRLVTIYAAKGSTFGLQSSQDFVLRTVEVMKSVLTPLGVSP